MAEIKQKIQFVREDVAAKYECLATEDMIIHAQGYSGMLSNINMKGAAHCVETKNGLVKEKAPAAEPVKKMDEKPAGKQ